MNTLLPFVFDNHVAHGAMVRIDRGVEELLGHRHYPPDLRRLLCEAMAAMPLLSTHLKFEGRINLQFQSQPATRSIAASQVDLLVAQIDHRMRLRAMAKAPSDAAGSFRELLEGGILGLLIEPAKSGVPASQALVLIEGERLQDALEGYFAQSEQLPTLIRLAVKDDVLCAFMLQRLPIESSSGSEDDWEHLRILASTLSDEELLEADSEAACERVLTRLFADAPNVRRFESRPIEVSCNCSRDSIARMLTSLGQDEVNSMIAEQEQITVACEFCGRAHQFTGEQAASLFLSAGDHASDTRH